MWRFLIDLDLVHGQSVVKQERWHRARSVPAFLLYSLVATLRDFRRFKTLWREFAFLKFTVVSELIYRKFVEFCTVRLV